MKYILIFTSITPLYLYAHMEGIELSSFLAVLASMGLSYSLYLLYRIERIKKERDQALEKQKADANILYLQSRYASMGETLANIAHQWKQPLNAIGTIQNNIKANLIFQGDISKEKLLSNVETSFKLLQHLGETIDTFYGFLAQQRRPDERFKISDPLETIRKITEYSLDNAHIQLRYDLQSDPEITGCANEFTHALLNLILNAKDAFDETDTLEPTITVRVRGDENECSIEVIDNAGGIRLEPVDLVFSLHVTSKTDGSGLGLFMTKKIIENRFGGKITARNCNGGACFTVTLPYLHDSVESTSFLSPDDKANIDHINRLAHKIIELEEAKNTLTKWADIFQHAHWGIAIHIGTSNNFELFNHSFHTLYGYNASEMKHLSVPDLFPEDTLPILSKVQEKAFSDGYVAFETVNRRKDGSLFPVSVELMAIKNDDGEVLYHIANVWDQSEKKEAEERLQLKRFALDRIKDAVFLIDSTARFHYVNEGACKALRYTREEMAQMSVGDIDPDWPNERWDEHWKALKNAGSMRMELRHRRKDGTVFPVEVSANYIEFGGKHYNMAIARDITERKAAEEKLLLQNFALDTINEAVYLIDQNSMFHYVNEGACKALGYTKEELQRMGVVHIDPGCSIGWWGIHWDDIKRLKTVTGIASHKRKDGTVFPIEVSSNYFEYNGTGYSLAVARDITERVRLEEQKENDRMRLFFERQVIGMAITSPEKGWLKTNRKIEEMLGYSFDELSGMSWAEITHPEDLSEDVRQFDLLLRGEIDDYMMEKRFIRKDGTILYVNLGVSCVRKDEGTVDYVLALMEDITDRKIVEAQLTRSEASLKEAQRVAKIGSWELELPSQKLTWSDETYRIFEIDPDQADNLHTIFYDYVHPEDRETVQQAYETSLATQTPFELMHRIVLPDGRIKYVLEACETKYDVNGVPILSIGTVQDVTERKHIEKELEDSHAFLTKLIDSLPDPIFVKDREHKWLILNKANYEFAGIEPGTLIGKSDYDFFPKEEADIFWAKDEEVFTSGQINVNEEYFTSADGVTHYIQTVKAMFTDSGGKEYLVGTIRDLSERKAMEDDLRKALEFNEGIIGAIPDLLFELSPDGTYVGVWAQNEALLAAQKEILLGHKFQDILPPDVAAICLEALQEVDEKGYSIGKMFSLDLPESKRWFELSVSKKKSSGNYIVLSRDITERKTAEEHVRFLNATLEERVKERTHQLMRALEFNEGIINALPDLLFEVDREGRYLGVWANNPELLAAQKEILLTHSFEEILSPEAARIAMEAIEEAETKGLSFGKTIEITLSDGIHWFELSASKKCTEGTFLFISRDISERVKAEKALREREEMFRAIVENSPDVISRYDLSMRRIYVNPMMQFLLGKPLDEILGKTPYEFSPLPDIENFERLFHAVVEGKSEIEHEGSYMTPWGERRWGNQRIVPIFNDAHDVEGVMLIGRDITEHYEHEKRLTMLESALNGSAEAIYINDANLNIIYVNDEACNMLEYTREEFMGMKITDIDADFSPEGIDDLIETKRIHKKVFFTTRHRTKGGTIINVEIAGSPFIHEGNEIFVSVVKDISPLGK